MNKEQKHFVAASALGQVKVFSYNLLGCNNVSQIIGGAQQAHENNTKQSFTETAGGTIREALADMGAESCRSQFKSGTFSIRDGEIMNES